MFVPVAVSQPFVVHQRREGHLMINECIDELLYGVSGEADR